MLQRSGMPADGSKPSKKARTSSLTPSSSGTKDHALVSIRISERTSSGRSSTMVATTRPPME